MIWLACDVMAAMLVDRNNKFFLLWVLTANYANFVNKFSFVLSTNMAAIQTTYCFLTMFYCWTGNKLLVRNNA